MMHPKIASVVALGVMLAAVAYGPERGLATAGTSAFIDCDGNACGQVRVTWDDVKQLYKVQNASTDKSVRVDAANLAASASVCIPPEKTDYLSLKSIVGAYHATYQQTCTKSE
jgi:hypothetical protein